MISWITWFLQKSGKSVIFACAVMFVLLWVTIAAEVFALVCDAHRSLTKFAAVCSGCLKLLDWLWLQPSVAVELICDSLCCVPAVSWLSSLIADGYGVTHSASARQTPGWLTCYMEPEISFILLGSVVFSPLSKWGAVGLAPQNPSNPFLCMSSGPLLSSVFIQCPFLISSQLY